ncbi:MAG: hypothetical protein Kow0047_29420 [Anaerolineae bacterium]
MIFALGLLSLAPYLLALRLGDLRQHTVGFEIAFLAAFGLYGVATAWALRTEQPSLAETMAIVGFSAAFCAIVIWTPPTLSDDMYRYVWEGRIQAHGFSPYELPPNAPELTALRDAAIWPRINRKAAVTVYPPLAQLTFQGLWRVWPDQVRWFQLVMALGGLIGGMLLIPLLTALGRSPARALIYLWSPLLIFELAHSAHVDGLILPLLIGAWLAHTRGREGIVGVMLGLATTIKFYPALLLPSLWRREDRRARWVMPAAFIATVILIYAPFVWRAGDRVLGFLPSYFQERFNMGAASVLIRLFSRLGVDPDLAVLAATLSALAVISLAFVLRPATGLEQRIRRGIWLIGTYTLLTQNLFPWYMLWVLPLVALFLEPDPRWGIKLDAWAGWWLFCGLVALAYTFFIRWRPISWAIWAQYIPLYVLLMAQGVNWLYDRRLRLLARAAEP